MNPAQAPVTNVTAAPAPEPELTPAQKGAITRAANKAAAEAKTAESDPFDNQLIIDDHDGAVFVADSLISLVAGHGKDVPSLADFWAVNKAPLNLLKTNFNDQFLRVKEVFTNAKLKVTTGQ
jgi:hypothetical protein